MQLMGRFETSAQHRTVRDVYGREFVARTRGHIRSCRRIFDVNSPYPSHLPDNLAVGAARAVLDVANTDVEGLIITTVGL